MKKKKEKYIEEDNWIERERREERNVRGEECRRKNKSKLLI